MSDTEPIKFYRVGQTTLTQSELNELKHMTQSIGFAVLVKIQQNQAEHSIPVKPELMANPSVCTSGVGRYRAHMEIVNLIEEIAKAETMHLVK